MKLLRYIFRGAVTTGVLVEDRVFHVENDLLEIIRSGKVPEIPRDGKGIPLAETTPLLPYDVPPKIWCIGLNYQTHAVDIQAVQPQDPASFIKPASCMFPPGGNIVLPPAEVSDDVDAEGKLGGITGKTSRFLKPGQSRAPLFA